MCDALIIHLSSLVSGTPKVGRDLEMAFSFLKQLEHLVFVEPAWEGESVQGPWRGAAFKFEGVKRPLKTLMKVLALLFRKKKNPYIIYTFMELSNVLKPIHITPLQ